MSLLRPALNVLGLVLLLLAQLLILPLILALVDHSSNRLAFGYSIAITLACGGLCLLVSRQRIERISPRQMFMVTGLSWVVVSVMSGLPFVLGETHMDIVDAIFEATSGITTTGSTVLKNLDHLPRDILLWRSLTQWLGGLGIIGMAVAIFPYLRVGGMRLFQTESSDWTENSTGRARLIAWKIVRTYIVLSILCALTYWLLGMDWFNSVNHAMTTISTGGYSTSDSSFGQFQSLSFLWAGIVFMLASAIPIVLYFQSIRARRWLITSDQQVRGLLLIALIVILLLIGVRLLEGVENYDFELISHSVFNIVSVITTTGYASQDYTLWGEAAVILIFCLTFVGGCSGSTSGGVKIFRFQLLGLLTREQTIRSVHPVATIKRHYNQRPVGENVLVSTISYFFIVMLCLAFFSIALAATGLDLVTSLTGAATTLMNVGPGLGNIIGPAGNFSGLNEVAKILLCFAMLLGRLEFLTLLVIFSPAFWKW